MNWTDFLADSLKNENFGTISAPLCTFIGYGYPLRIPLLIMKKINDLQQGGFVIRPRCFSPEFVIAFLFHCGVKSLTTLKLIKYAHNSITQWNGSWLFLDHGLLRWFFLGVHVIRNLLKWLKLAFSNAGIHYDFFTLSIW